MDLAPPFTPTGPGRRSARLCCVAAALALNIVAVEGVARLPAKPYTRALPTVTTVQVSAVRADSAATPGAAPSGRPSADAAFARSRQAPRPAPMVPQAPPPAPRTAVAVPPPAVDPEPALDGATARFYTFNEVEVPAAPADDWALDAAALDSARIGRLVFELFVDDAGKVVDCKVVEPTDLEAEVRASIEERLRTTVLLPARRIGRAVDSVRRIELTVSMSNSIEEAALT